MDGCYFEDMRNPPISGRTAVIEACFALKPAADVIVAVGEFSGLTSSICALARAAAKLLMVWLDRWMVGSRSKKVKADGAGLGPLGAEAMTDRLLGILWHKILELDLGLLVLKMRSLGRENTAANSALAREPFDCLQKFFADSCFGKVPACAGFERHRNIRGPPVMA